MDQFIFFSDLLLIIGVILFFVGTFLFFVPGLLVKWNSIGNTWLGRRQETVKHANLAKLFFTANYAIFANHRLTGGVMWGLSSIFLLIYIYYR